ncbi:hypothetical protein OIV83_002258 [Microbotryomycetes sp. JL201]|nr:hypothetical protein OIV83_002258 [Microbotryomycetes sp. JL201]
MGIGPELPPELAAQLGRQTSSANSADSTATSIGPEISTNPNQAAGTSQDARDESEDDDDFGPSLPPDLAASRHENYVSSSSKNAQSTVLGPTRPPSSVIGPSLPPQLDESAPVRKRETPLSNMYSDDSDDDYGPGPMPPPQGVGMSALDDNDGVRQFKEREQREQERRRKEQEDKGKIKREEWMLVPPKELDLAQSLDPTKLKARGFSQKATSDKPSSSQSGVDLWTETPQERAQRLADEALGIRKKAVQSRTGGGEGNLKDIETEEQRRKRKRDEQLKKEVEDYNRSSRKDSLLDQHSKAKKAKKDKGETEEPAAFWDRDRDMAVGGRLMDDGKRRDVIRNAKELGGRFGGGSFL